MEGSQVQTLETDLRADAVYDRLPEEIRKAAELARNLVVCAWFADSTLRSGHPEHAGGVLAHLEALGRILTSAKGPITHVEAELSARRQAPYETMNRKFGNAHLAALAIARAVLFAAAPSVGSGPCTLPNPSDPQYWRNALVQHEVVTPEFQAGKNWRRFVKKYNKYRPWFDREGTIEDLRFELAPFATGSPPVRRAGEAPNTETPHWNPDTRTLSFRGQEILRCKRAAPNQEAVLNAMQMSKWAPRIDYPLPRDQIPNTIRDLQKRLKNSPIRIGRDGTGRGLTWRKV
jgi:hypothetical protein